MNEPRKGLFVDFSWIFNLKSFLKSEHSVFHGSSYYLAFRYSLRLCQTWYGKYIVRFRFLQWFDFGPSRVQSVEPISAFIRFIQLFAPSNMSLGCYVIAIWESKGEGIQWSNLGKLFIGWSLNATLSLESVIKSIKCKLHYIKTIS